MDTWSPGGDARFFVFWGFIFVFFVYLLVLVGELWNSWRYSLARGSMPLGASFGSS